MAIKENLLFVADSIMRHAQRDDPKTASAFEKALEPVIKQLFKDALRRPDTRRQIAEYAMVKLIPTWREHCWFRRVMPSLLKLLKEPQKIRLKGEEALAPKVQLSPAFDMEDMAAALSEVESPMPSEAPDAAEEPAYVPWMQEPHSLPSPLEEPEAKFPEAPSPEEPSVAPLPTEVMSQALSDSEDADLAPPVTAEAAVPSHPMPSVSTVTTAPTERAPVPVTEVASSGEAPTTAVGSSGLPSMQQPQPSEPSVRSSRPPLTATSLGPPTDVFAGLEEPPTEPVQPTVEEPSSPTEVPLDEESIPATSPVADEDMPDPTSPAPSLADELTEVPLVATMEPTIDRRLRSPTELPVLQARGRLPTPHVRSPTEVPVAPMRPPASQRVRSPTELPLAGAVGGDIAPTSPVEEFDDETGPLPPTSPAPGTPTLEELEKTAPLPFLAPVVTAQRTPALRSPTEVPVPTLPRRGGSQLRSPTEVPVPSLFGGREATEVRTPTELPVPSERRGAGSSAPIQYVSATTSAEPASPTEVPVPTEMPPDEDTEASEDVLDEVPAPTSPVPSPIDDRTHTPTVIRSSARSAQPLDSSVVPATSAVMASSAVMGSSARMGSTARSPTELPYGTQRVTSTVPSSSPSEMPVPTEQPSPTSPAPDGEEVAQLPEPASAPQSSVLSAVLMSSSQSRPPLSPTEVPVPVL